LFLVLEFQCQRFYVQGGSAVGSATPLSGFSHSEVIEALTPVNWQLSAALTSILSEPLNDALHNSPALIRWNMC
jgi:hypothetical protein